MKNLNPNKDIANRKISEILSRFNRKIKRSKIIYRKQKNCQNYQRVFKINCPIDKLEKILKILL